MSWFLAKVNDGANKNSELVQRDQNSSPFARIVADLLICETDQHSDFFLSLPCGGTLKIHNILRQAQMQSLTFRLFGL